jgi:SPP1 gp7 family putative phage head morphogenesis protein
MAFDRTNPEALKWARERSAMLVTEVTAETRDAIRQVVARAFEEGIPPRQAARLLQDVVGLRTDQVNGVLSTRKKLMDAALRADKLGRAVAVKLPNGASIMVPPGGLTPEKMSALLKRLAEKARRQRALLIARTETIAASNAGQQELWRQAVENGLLRGNELQRWSVAHDERLCDVCRPLDGVVVPLGAKFQTSLGPVTGPPAHPNCRCAVVMQMPARRAT